MPPSTNPPPFPAPPVPRPQVLLVDDEAMILQVYALVLERHMAVDCHQARNAAEALVRLDAQSYHVLLTDMVMPGVSGVELLHQARRLQPGLACGLMSGYLNGLEVANLPANVFYLPKPFTMDQLITAMKQALAGSPAD